MKFQICRFRLPRCENIRVPQLSISSITLKRKIEPQMDTDFRK